MREIYDLVTREQKAVIIETKADKEEIKELPPLGDFILCTLCGTRHIIRYGKEKMEDGTMVESKKLSFVTCKEVDYIVGLNGKDIRQAPLKEEVE